MYPLLRRILFLFDAESVHYFTMDLLRFACSIPPIRTIIRKTYSAPDLPVNVFGLTFKNPIGLAAGFDKNARYLDALSLLGFGFIEVGTATPVPQPGNDRPRLFRLPKDRAIINRMGFNNDGAVAIAERVKKFRDKKTNVIIGGNIGKNKKTPNEDAWRDYEKCFNILSDAVDYIVVNVSSPNTPGLRELQQKGELRKILSHLQALNKEREKPLPILLKIAPDLNEENLKDIVDLAMELKLNGLVATNTTVSRKDCRSDTKKIKSTGNGGLSGLPLEKKSTEFLKIISARTQNRIPAIGSGGVMDERSAFNKFDAGAVLIQVFTGFIYSGPGIVKQLVRAIKKRSDFTAIRNINL